MAGTWRKRPGLETQVLGAVGLDLGPRAGSGNQSAQDKEPEYEDLGCGSIQFRIQAPQQRATSVRLYT